MMTEIRLWMDGMQSGGLVGQSGVGCPYDQSTRLRLWKSQRSRIAQVSGLKYQLSNSLNVGIAGVLGVREELPERLCGTSECRNASAKYFNFDGIEQARKHADRPDQSMIQGNNRPCSRLCSWYMDKCLVPSQQG